MNPRSFQAVSISQNSSLLWVLEVGARRPPPNKNRYHLLSSYRVPGTVLNTSRPSSPRLSELQEQEPGLFGLTILHPQQPAQA